MTAGYRHEALVYDDDEELLATAVPFLRDATDAGEAALVSMGERSAGLIRSALPRSAAVVYASGDDVYRRPAGAIRSYRDLMAGLVADGVPRIRLIGELPADVFGPAWDGWMRYEAAANVAYAEFPLWAMCAYDRRVTGPARLDDVAHTHPGTAAYAGPVAFLTRPHAAPPDPLEAMPPAADLLDPVPAAARAAVRAADPGGVPADAVTDLVLAVSEAVTNAIRHGRPPVRVRVWPGGDRLVVAVSDGGPGPADPYAGLLPVAGGPDGGRGMWIIQQSADQVVLRRGPDGCTLRLTAGVPG